MSYKIATIRVNGVTATAEIHSAIPAGIVGAYVELVFPDPYWTGLIKNVQFEGGIPPILGVGDTVVIPAALVAQPNSLIKIGIIGVAEDGKTEITPTLWAELGTVRPSAGYIPEDNGSGDGEIPETDPETWAQLLAMIGNLRNLTTEQQTSLVAAINEVNEKAGGIAELQELVYAMGETLEPLITTVDELKQTDENTAQALGDVRKEIAALKAFHPIEVKTVSNNVGTVELGVSIDAVTVSWVLNKTPVSQTVDGEAVDAAERSAVVTGPFTSGKKFIVTATDAEGNTASKSTSIAFYNGVYYGALPTGVLPDSAAILGLTRKLQGGYGATINYTPSAGKRPSYACPTGRSGTPKFVIGGFEYAWTKLGTIDFTNASSYTEKYDVWQHPQDVTESMTITVS